MRTATSRHRQQNLPRRAPTKAVPKYRANIGLGPRRLSVRQASSAYIATAKGLGPRCQSACPFAGTVHRSRTRQHLPSTGKGGLQGSSSVGFLHWSGKLLPKATSKWAFRGPLAVVANGQNFRGDPGSPVATWMEREQKSQDGFSRRSSESVPRRRSLAFPSIRRLDSGKCSQAPDVHLENLAGVAPASGCACPDTTYWRFVLKHVFEKCAGPSTGSESQPSALPVRWNP
ncbi:hypothetical protein GWK47_014690 [Chionoecetes opilio]|uniref:Uncharacterized protein n=1 Tax=Chionoecetes opilio TaxID=41210 RepID=A0A8J4XSP0_CHIOP|nr:hypothetical protein GWK47_014690 [Chionoecetes opilio]